MCQGRFQVASDFISWMIFHDSIFYAVKMAEFKYMTDYHTEFDPKVYLNMFYSNSTGNENEEGFEDFHLRTFHKLWSRIGPSLSTASTDVRYLEYGGGPCVSNLISASPNVNRIVFAEYTEANRQAVVSWVAGRQDAHDWSPLIQFVVGDLEGVQGDDSVSQAVSKRQEDMKRKIKSIVPCDVTKNPIVDLESVDQNKPFDVVCSTLCLEASVSSEQQYKSAVSSLCEFLNPGGYLIMYAVLEQTYYVVGEQKFYTFPLTKTMMVEAMKEGGIEEIDMETIETDFGDVVCDCHGLCTVFGRKSA